MTSALLAPAGVVARPDALPRLLLLTDLDHREHCAATGPLPAPGAAALVRLASDSGLTGRGGAAFPTGRKLAAVLAARRPVVVGNGAEGEPASSKDRLLLTRAPHLVLDGLVIAARAFDAAAAYLYAPADLLHGPVRAAVAQRGDAAAIRLVAAPDTFVSGQDTAVVAALDGRPALPRTTPPPTYVRGVGGRPTLLHNVETLAHLALVARFGADWFRGLGTGEEAGTRLHTISGAVRHPGVYELPGGAPLSQALAAAGGPRGSVQALLVGGYHGGWVPWGPSTQSLPLSRTALRPFDAAPGAGVVIALGADRCGLRAGADIAGYLAGQNAGQCGPCRNGLPALAALLDDLAERRAGKATCAQLQRLTGLVDGRGACAHPAGTARLVRSTLRAFDAEVRRHLAGTCSAAVTAGSARR